MGTELQAKILFLIVMFGLMPNANSCKREEMEMVQMITRHGDISPLMTYPKDPNPERLWSEGLNDLTMLGKFQSYTLGYAMRLFYENFITSDPSELEVFSSTEKDCFKSTQAFITALYSPNSNWEIVQDFPYQPIYINTGSHIDKYLALVDCAAAEEEYQNLLRKETDSLFSTYEELIDYWEENSGKKLDTVADVENLYNCVNTEALYNLTIPPWVESTFEQLKYFHDAAFRSKLDSDLLKRLKAGVFVDTIITAMEKKTSGELNKTKVITYTTHGSHLAALMNAMDVWDQKHPDPCSTLLVELYRHEGDPFVRFLHLNSTSPKRLPYPIFPLTLPGCSEFCPLSYVREHLQKVVPDDWEEECKKRVGG